MEGLSLKFAKQAQDHDKVTSISLLSMNWSPRRAKPEYKDCYFQSDFSLKKPCKTSPLTRGP